VGLSVGEVINKLTATGQVPAHFRIQIQAEVNNEFSNHMRWLYSPQ
jgi:hypothetical protein